MTSTLSRPLTLTLALLKPDVVAHPNIVLDIRQKILQSGFYFISSKKLRLKAEEAELFYAEHRGKFFQSRLVSFMSSGPLWAHILCADDAVSKWRKMLGNTKVLKTIYSEPESIRGKHGLTDTRNCAHGSDSAETADREISFFFPDFNTQKWYKEEHSYFREGLVEFDSIRCRHLSVSSENKKQTFS